MVCSAIAHAIDSRRPPTFYYKDLHVITHKIALVLLKLLAFQPRTTQKGLLLGRLLDNSVILSVL